MSYRSNKGSISSQLDGPFDELSVDFLAGFCAYHPVSATFLGVHDFDARLPDDSASRRDERLRELVSLEARLEACEPANVSDAVRTDHRVIAGAIRIERWEIESRYRLQDPSYYLGEAIFGVVSLLLRPFAPWGDRASACVERLAEFPRFLESARLEVTRVAPSWRERTQRELLGGRTLLEGSAFEEMFRDVEGFDPARRAALVALEEFDAWLTSLPALDCPSASEPALAQLMRDGHFLAISPHEMLGAAEKRLAESTQALRSEASAFAVSDWREALAKLGDHHPAPSEYSGRFQVVWEESRRFATERHLVSWPRFPLHYAETPNWAREGAPYLYFLPYRSPAPFDGQEEVVSFITPIEAGASAEEAKAAVRRCNDSVIKLNHVVHHGGIGHHVQNYYAARAPGLMARVASTDCASRIAFLSGGTMAEGWACYATELMNESGFLTPLESYSQHHAMARIASRAVVDVAFHCGEMSFDEACRFYERETNMTPSAARAEVTKNSQFPGAALMYLSGMTGIQQLRERARTTWGGEFSLLRFHDRLLSFGSLPVALIAEQFFAPGD